MLLATDADLLPGETLAVVTATAEDTLHRVYGLSVEYLEKVPLFDWLTQVGVRLPDQLINGGDVDVSITIAGLVSNKVRVTIRA